MITKDNGGHTKLWRATVLVQVYLEEIVSTMNGGAFECMRCRRVSAWRLEKIPMPTYTGDIPTD